MLETNTRENSADDNMMRHESSRNHNLDKVPDFENIQIYPGLNPYFEEDSDYFFGRDEDIQNIITYLYAKPLTILHGESGVGKSSVLQAGVIYNINGEVRENLKYYEVPKLAIVIFNNWSNQKDISAELLNKIKQEIGDLNGQVQLIDIKDNFLENLKDWVKYLDTEEKGGNIFIILDKFEEYLFQSPNKDFESNLIRALNDPDLQVHVHFLISLRSDAITLIDDRFKGHLRGRDDDPLSHRIPLKHLNGQSAKDAIIKPIRIYNQQQREKQQLEVEEPDDDLVNEVLNGVEIKDKLGDNDEHLIEAPLLQLVMKSLWDEVIEQWNKNKKKHKEPETKPKLSKDSLDKLAEALGKKFDKQFKKDKTPVELIAQNHLRTQYLKLKKIDKLKKIEKIEYVIALIFYYLVTPTGEKIAYNIEGLVSHFKDACQRYKLLTTGSNEESIVKKIIEILSQSDYRILRPLANQKYEIFHNIFCKLIYEWVEEYKGKLDQELVVQEQKLATQEQNKINILVQNLAFQSIQKNQGGEYDLSTRLACAAYGISKYKEIPLPNQVNQVLRELLTPQYFYSKNLCTCGAEVSSVAFSPNGNWLACGSYEGNVRVWKWESKQIPTETVNPILILHSQDGQIGSVALTDDGKLAAGSDRGTVYFVNLNNLSQSEFSLIPLSNNKHKNEVRAVAFSRDGKWLASGGWDNTVKVWDISKPEVELFCPLEHKDWIWSVAFHPQNNHILATGCRNGSIQLWYIDESVPTPQLIETLSVHVQKDWEQSTLDIQQEDEIFTVVFSPDGKTLAAGGRNQIIYLWNIDLDTDEKLVVSEQPNKKLEGHKNMVRTLSFSPNSKKLASGSEDLTIKLWDCESGLCLLTRKQHKLGVSAIAFSPCDSGKKLVSGSWDHSVLLWEERDYQTTFKTLTGHKNLVKGIAFIDNRSLASGSYDKTVKKWNLGDDKVGEQGFAFSSEDKPDDLPGQEKEVRTIACSPDSHWLASGGVKGVLLWDLTQSNDKPFSLDDKDTRVVAFSPNNEFLAAASFDGENNDNKKCKIKLWRVKDRSFLHDFEPNTRNDKRIIRTVVFDSKSRWLAAGGDEGTLWLWDCYAPWELVHEKKISESEEINSIAFSPNSQWLAAATEADHIYLWKVDRDSQSSPISKSESSLIKNARGRTVTFGSNSNSQTLVAGDRTGVIRIWDLNHPDATPIELEGHKHRINAIALSPNDKILASASDDTTIRLWIVETEQLIKMACNRVDEIKLGQEDWKNFIGEIINYESNDYEKIYEIIKPKPLA
jgi:WD40 repeat protein